eukprot:gene61-82_t
MHCMFNRWYDDFKSVTFTSAVIPLPKVFIDYLNSDHFAISKESFPEYKCDEDIDDEEWSTNYSRPSNVELNKQYYQSYDSSDSDSDEEEDEDSNNNSGNVMPKLNWSAPRDATWMNIHGTMKCSTATDVLLLLKSSDFINHDLSQFAITSIGEADESMTPYTLVLRKWHNLFHSMEFRCFVKDDQLIGICQRDTSTFYDFLVTKKTAIGEAIELFYRDKIMAKFKDNSYFNPVHPSTDSLLFEWDELFPELFTNDEEGAVPSVPLTSLEMRIVENNDGIKPNLAMTSRLPKDLMNTSKGSPLDDMLNNFREQNLNPQ